MIIKINDKNGNNIAQCILQQDEYGNWFQKESDNCKHIYVDTEQTKYGFEDALDIDVDILTNITYEKTMKALNDIIEDVSYDYIYSTFDNNYEEMGGCHEPLTKTKDYGYMIEVFSELIEPNRDNCADYGVSDKYIDDVVRVRNDMRALAVEVEHDYSEYDVEVTLSKWNEGCEFGMALYIWIPMQ